MKKLIATLTDSGDRSGFIEYGLIAAILVMALVGVLSSGDEKDATLQQRPIQQTESARQHSSLLTGLAPLFEMTSGGHRD